MLLPGIQHALTSYNPYNRGNKVNVSCRSSTSSECLMGKMPKSWIYQYVVGPLAKQRSENEKL